ncbi:MAG: hypothetical protein O2905_04910 [Proteobacteria bacterium]|nr:hypothetical protein [Pseudomonadota bacterium]
MATPENDSAANRTSDQVQEADLDAQQKTAWAAIFQAVFTLVALYLIWRTLVATNKTLSEAKEATRAANKTAKEAERQANIAERAFKDAERPIIALDLSQARIIPNPGDGDMYNPNVTIEVWNFGKRPAILGMGLFELRIVDLGEQIAPPNPDSARAFNPSSRMLGPNRSANFGVGTKTAFKSEKLRDLGRQIVILVGDFEYSGPSGDIREQGVCYAYSRDLGFLVWEETAGLNYDRPKRKVGD